MISKEQVEAITKKIGSLDAPALIEKLNTLGVGENLELADTSISIPKSVVKDLPKLKGELSSFSKTGRAFEITEEGEKLIIDITSQNLLYLFSSTPMQSIQSTEELMSHPRNWSMKG